MDEQAARLGLALRQAGIFDPPVLAAMQKTPRNLFVSETYQTHAWHDEALPIDCNQTISQPSLVAYMSVALKVSKRDKVLEIGTGSGYQTAILAHLCRRVYSLERHSILYKQARARFHTLGLSNITSMLGDGLKGWPQQAPFDRIMVTAAAETIPEELVNQLKIGGLMLLPLVEKNPTQPIAPEWDRAYAIQKLVRVTRLEQGFDCEELIAVQFVPLIAGIAK
ncbi:MAG: protein-L-isoaspartate(D-aspartate) O-methyltransferase [Alphaproteobacteria bacterium]|nr:protein-L-isoaspartate(D-aspartate) O-methyltransferase [Alphaproteobacteria bacterium]